MTCPVQINNLLTTHERIIQRSQLAVPSSQYDYWIGSRLHKKGEAAAGTSTPPPSAVSSYCLIFAWLWRISLAFSNVSCIAPGEMIPRVAEEARHESIEDRE